MRAAVRRLYHRLGRRGCFLTLKGVMAVLYGYSLIAEPTPNPIGLRLLLHVMPLCGWGVAWMCAGGIALACAPMQQGRDWPGFTAVWLISVPWALTFLVSWWPLGDNSRGWITACIFGAFGLVCLNAVGWSEPLRAARTRRDARER